MGAPPERRDPAVPRLVPRYQGEFSFPRSGSVCLAYNGGELRPYSVSGPGVLDLADSLLCLGDPYAAPDDLPFVPTSWLPPPLPARESLGDGSLRFRGTTSLACRDGGSLALTVDLPGRPVASVPPSSVDRSRVDVVVTSPIRARGRRRRPAVLREGPHRVRP